MEKKESDWLKKRAGKITSSNLKKLFTGGRRDLTDAERAVIGGNRKTIDVEFGETAISYLYQLQREKRLQKPTYQREIYNLEFGKKAEPIAIQWLRANKPDWIIKHCDSSDFDEIPFCLSEAGAGDSPDGYVGLSGVLEVKCPVDQAKFEQLRDMTAEEVRPEYEYQFANHLNCNPTCSKLIYLCYDAMVDDDPMDVTDPLDPSRGILFEYDRSEFQELIDQIEEKVKKVMRFLADVDAGKCRVRDINTWQG